MQDVPKGTMDTDRYRYHVMPQQIGQHGHAKRLESHVAIVGLGALGSAMADQLARAGIGRLHLIDDDVVEISNIQRQRYNQSEAAERARKVDATKEQILRINDEIDVRVSTTRLTAENCGRLLGDADLIADGLDNFETRFVLNDYTIAEQKAFVAGGVGELGGWATTAITIETPCLRCLEESLADAPVVDLTHVGILNTVPAIVASLQATEILRYLMEGSPRLEKCNILYFNAWRRQFGKMEFKKRADCPCCVRREFAHRRLT